MISFFFALVTFLKNEEVVDTYSRTFQLARARGWAKNRDLKEFNYLSQLLTKRLEVFLCFFR